MSVERDAIRAYLQESCRVKQSFSDELLTRIETFAVRSAEALARGAKMVFFGNGGSAADAQHLAAELTVKLLANRKGLPALALTTNSSVLTAAANDLGFESIFSRQVESLVSPGDVVIALSTSGTSPNLLRALDTDAARKAFRVAFTGETGGELASRVDLLLNVPSRNPQHIQEAHITIGHIACALIEQMRTGRAAG
jgi:D-sedoheptulose 7-phosphate isomerase